MLSHEVNTVGPLAELTARRDAAARIGGAHDKAHLVRVDGLGLELGWG